MAFWNFEQEESHIYGDGAIGSELISFRYNVEAGFAVSEARAEIPSRVCEGIVFRSLIFRAGEMAEWLKAHAWKACIP